MSKGIKVIGIVMAGWGKAGLIAELRKVKWGSEGGPIEYKNFSGICFFLHYLTNHSHKNRFSKFRITVKSEEDEFIVEGWTDPKIIEKIQEGERGVKITGYELTAEPDETNTVQYKIELMALS